MSQKLIWPILGIAIMAIAIISLVVQNQNLQGRLTAQQQQDSVYNMQTQCANYAAQAAPGIENSIGIPEPHSSYTDHWNQSLRKCFIKVINQSSDGSAMTISVDDAIAGTDYALISIVNGTVTPGSCQLIPNVDGSNFLPCSSMTDFNNFVTPLMYN